MAVSCHADNASPGHAALGAWYDLWRDGWRDNMGFDRRDFRLADVSNCTALSPIWPTSATHHLAIHAEVAQAGS